jgi:hypothetical protein
MANATLRYSIRISLQSSVLESHSQDEVLDMKCEVWRSVK